MTALATDAPRVEAGAAGAGPPGPEDELCLLLAGTAERRDRAAERVCTLAHQVDRQRLYARLGAHRLSVVCMSRLREMVPDALSSQEVEALEQTIARNRQQAGVTAALLVRICQALEGHGVPAVPMKGALLAERIYPEVGWRSPSVDMDLVVRPSDMTRALEVLGTLGYELGEDLRWIGDLPMYHHWLIPRERPWPRVEVHWRVHWYERAFAAEVVERSVPDGGHRRMLPADELAVLLLVYARDGLTSLRLAADLAAWWDTYGAGLRRPALEATVQRHPRLSAALDAAAMAAEAVVGIPRTALVDAERRPGRRARTAVRLLDWRGEPDERRRAIDTTLIDLLLTPPAAAWTFVRHYWFQPLDKYAVDYGWPAGQRVRNELRRLAHVTARAWKSARDYSARLWQVRGGRQPHPLPAFDDGKATA